MEVHKMDVIEMLLDENCNDNITLYDEDGEATEFEQIAVIPIDDVLYFILRPIGLEDLDEDEAFVFVLRETEEEEMIDLVEDDEIIDRVFAIYNELLDEE